MTNISRIYPLKTMYICLKTNDGNKSRSWPWLLYFSLSVRLTSMMTSAWLKEAGCHCGEGTFLDVSSAQTFSLKCSTFCDLTLIWSCSPAYSIDWKMFHVHLRLISSRATYWRYQRWISRAALIAEDWERKRKSFNHNQHAEVILFSHHIHTLL